MIMRNRYGGLIIKKILLSLSVVLVLTMFSSCKNEQAKGEITYYKVKVSDIKDVIKVTGVIRPEVGAEIKVGSRISGTLKKLYVKVGDYVRKGDLIAVIEHNDLKLKIKELEYNLKYYKNELHSVLSEYPERIKSKSLSISALAIKKKYLLKKLKRNKVLYKDSMLSKQNLENIESDFKSLNKNIAAGKSDLKALKEEFKYKSQSIRLKIKQLRQQIEIAKIDLNYAFIKAPISGVISSISTQEGETVAASFSSPVFVNIIDLSRLEAVAYIDETDIGKVKTGQTVYFYVEAFPMRKYSGKIKKIYPKAEISNNVVTYKIEVDINDKKNKNFKEIKPEMTAYLDIVIKDKKGVLTAPLKCFKLIEGKNFAFLKNGKGKTVKKMVKLGIVNNGVAEITEGLKEGDEIVIKGFKYVHSI